MKELGTIRVMIVDDHPIVREGLSAVLHPLADMCVVAETGSGEEAVAAFREHQPDVTLMDLRMPQMDGLEAIQAIREEYPAARILILTTYDGDENIYRALKAGAKGYLLKTAPHAELLNAIRMVQSGQSYLPAAIAAQLAERMNRPLLTARELAVLEQVASGSSNQEIGSALFITEGTVKAHINRILHKLGVTDRTQATISAINRGIVHLR